MPRCRVCEFEAQQPDDVVWHFSQQHGLEWRAIIGWIRKVMGEGSYYAEAT